MTNASKQRVQASGNEISGERPERSFEPLTISPEGQFRMNCWAACEVWDALTIGRLPHHSVSIAELRSKLLYRVLFAFFYQFHRIDSLDDKIIGTAVWHIKNRANACDPWDGGKAIRESWAADWGNFISSTSRDEIKEWSEKYALIRRDLFDGSPTGAGVQEQALCIHADAYLEKILKRCMKVEFVLEGESPDDFPR